MQKTTLNFTKTAFGILIAGSFFLFNSCDKEKQAPTPQKTSIVEAAVQPAVQNQPITQILTVANISKPESVTPVVMFNKNAQIFSVSEATVLEHLQNAFENHTPLKVTFNPWQATVLSVAELTPADKLNYVSAPVTKGGKFISTSSIGNLQDLDDVSKLGVINTTTPGTLTNVVPDFATAQMMFTYLTKQCCKLPGPYGVDYCISFQYAPDGCYARAHKMCYTINTKYKYATHKIFSFANAGWDQLSVQAQKWGGCCVNWWYHVAPLVNVQTPTGVKAYVFDPAMFDQPVLLSVWLHAQENPVCVSWATPNVSMINLQPTESYAPADYTGLNFVQDPAYSDSNSTLVAYSNLTTCP